MVCVGSPSLSEMNTLTLRQLSSNGSGAIAMTLRRILRQVSVRVAKTPTHTPTFVLLDRIAGMLLLILKAVSLTPAVGRAWVREYPAMKVCGRHSGRHCGLID